eukprot:bmy_14994T0
MLLKFKFRLWDRKQGIKVKLFGFTELLFGKSIKIKAQSNLVSEQAPSPLPLILTNLEGRDDFKSMSYICHKNYEDHAVPALQGAAAEVHLLMPIHKDNEVRCEKANGTTVHTGIHQSKVAISRLKLDKDQKILTREAKSGQVVLKVKDQLEASFNCQKLLHMYGIRKTPEANSDYIIVTGFTSLFPPPQSLKRPDTRAEWAIQLPILAKSENGQKQIEDLRDEVERRKDELASQRYGTWKSTCLKMAFLTHGLWRMKIKYKSKRSFKG